MQIEAKLQNVIYEKYQLNLDEQESVYVKTIDDTLLYYEFIGLMDEKIFDDVPSIQSHPDLTLRSFSSVENEFISIFRSLTYTNSGKSYVGIDGCRDGWAVVEISNAGFDIGIYSQIDEICFKYINSKSIIIDIPIGLPESEEDIRPDALARNVLSSRASCIFNSPCRQAVYSEDYKTANETNKSILGKGLSKQPYMIMPKIKEIDVFLEHSPEFKNRLLEAHPEVCFAMLNMDEKYRIPTPIYENKKTEEGIYKRLELLSQYYERTDEIARYIFEDHKLRKMIDDVIDALCLAVVGKVGDINGLETIPDEPMKDQRGLFMQMVYAKAD